MVYRRIQSQQPIAAYAVFLGKCYLLVNAASQMADKRRYTVTLPDHVADAVEQHARPLGSTPTEYTADVVRWWFGQGCPPVTHDEAALRNKVTDMMSRNQPLPKDFNIWKLNTGIVYQLIDEPVEKALHDLGIPNLFAHAAEHDVVRFLVAFDNHPTHWLVFNLFKGGKTASENGLALSAYPKVSTTREDMLLKLAIESKKMGNGRPIEFSQIPAKAATRAAVKK
jgi:hypothetical protein